MSIEAILYAYAGSPRLKWHRIPGALRDTKGVDNSFHELYKYHMEIVADASAFLAVVLDEVDREWVIENTFGYAIASPEVLPYEIANALIAVRRKGRLTDEEVFDAFEMSQKIAVRLLPVSISAAMRIATRFRIHAYDAFYIQCCVEAGLPLISLDKRMCDVAQSLGIKVLR